MDDRRDPLAAFSCRRRDGGWRGAAFAPCTAGGIAQLRPRRRPRAPMRGMQLEPLTAASADATGQNILAPHLFDGNATEVEVTRAADPFALTEEPTVEVLKNVRIFDYGGVYLQIVLEQIAAAPDEHDSDAMTPPAANDEMALASRWIKA